MADGLLGKCKECTKSDVRKNRKDNIEYYRKFDRERSNLTHRVAARKEYSLTDAGRTAKARAARKYHKKYPNKRKAINAIQRALKSGDIIKPEKCESCNNADQLEAHHSNYNYPLSVKWLCVSCHVDWHKNNTATYD